MSVNDLLVQGAKPIFFLDYVAINKLKYKKVKNILDGIVSGCKLAECALIGGETAEMPGTYAKNKFDLAGFAVGVVEKKNLLTKSKIKSRDIVLAVPSSGLHSNGFSLVLDILKKKTLIMFRVCLGKKGGSEVVEIYFVGKIYIFLWVKLWINA